jgi:transposase-like protein
MSHLETQETTQEIQALPIVSQSVRSHCPDCQASLVVVRVMGGRAGSEYWTMRCTRCGGIHLDIVKAPAEPVGA